jgi:hypothetical protein
MRRATNPVLFGRNGRAIVGFDPTASAAPPLIGSWPAQACAEVSCLPAAGLPSRRADRAKELAPHVGPYGLLA